ncbi:histidine phosphatase family protein [Paradesulfitobacterium ferrireducens]|uniref:histidine phosphatase family protein n=1 Tax=Paradesulfitobacterium ferrireducens TaxID=2816476 RepID=UPI001A8DEFF5|nr:histidine phosphatase family protein [Paradesulfitobacterium ferrireducens]
MTKIILTRHGETQWNIEGRVQGMLDSPLTERGLNQAKRLASRLKQEGIQYLYASDRPRALATAEVIRTEIGLTAPVLPAPQFRELSFGEWEGKVWAELRESYTDIFAVWDKSPYLVQIPGGETMPVVAERAWDYLKALIKKHAGETICIVTHGLTLKLLVTKALGFDVSDWKKTPWQFNTALNILEHNGNAILPMVLGDCTHLEDME